jgi:hypothetical protein
MVWGMGYEEAHPLIRFFSNLYLTLLQEIRIKIRTLASHKRQNPMRRPLFARVFVAHGGGLVFIFSLRHLIFL